MQFSDFSDSCHALCLPELRSAISPAPNINIFEPLNFSNRKYLEPLAHGFIWLCLFLYPFLFHYLPFSDYKAVARIAILLLLVMALFYTNTFLLIPKLLGKKKIFLYLLAVVLLLALLSSINAYAQVVLNPEYEKKPSLFNTALNTAVIASVLAWFISTVIKLTTEWYSNQRLMQAAENDKLNAELNFLKSQVNPHFLFNSLNNIYALQNKKSPETGDAILRLSQLIRYMVYETGTEFVPLQKEIDYLNDYVGLQKLGLNPSVRVNFKVSGDAGNIQIQPMLLIPLIENVFKHGISYRENCNLNIDLKISDTEIELKTENRASKKDNNRTGIGLNNLEKRLQMLYPGKHSLDAKTVGDIYSCRLQIILK